MTDKICFTPKELSENIHQVKLHKSLRRTVNSVANSPEVYRELPDKLALRAFFTRVKNVRKESKEPEFKVKYTVFLEPVPFLCRYNIGDEELKELQPIFFDGFREARYTFVRLLDVWYKRYRKMRTSGDLP